MIILVVEDEPVNGSTLSSLLRERGHTVEWATDARSVYIKLPVTRPDVVVMDWVLPDGDGRDTLREVAKTNARVIVFTALAPTDLSIVMSQYPNVTFISKPTNLDHIISLVEGSDQYSAKY